MHRTPASLAVLLGGLLLTGSATVSASETSAAMRDYDGAELYALNCANCHGTYGEGDGRVTPALSVVLLDLRYLTARNDGTFPTDFVRDIVDGRETRAAHGPRGMPVWGAEFARSEGTSEAAESRVAGKIDALTSFLETIQLDAE